jgi:cyclopropane-fatty-acyl-phospholipid synthase
MATLSTTPIEIGDTMPTSSSTSSVADALEPLISALFRGPSPLRIDMWDGSSLGPDTATTIRLHSPTALRRLLWAPGELGLARAYVSGDIQLEGSIFDLLAVRDRFVDDDGVAAEAGFTIRMLPRLWRAARQLGVLGPPPPPPAVEAHLHGLRHVKGRDAQAISHHYDVGNDFYRIVLGPSLTYSCAYWADESFDLTDAQTAKYELISRKLDLQPGMRLLDVGCGWGGMVLHAARHHGVRAVGITLSHEQATLARERVRDAGLEDRIDIRVQDYRDISDGPFDAISSIGMFEHVGLARAEEYFQDLYDLLAPGARLLNHAISRPDPTRAAIAPRSFMARYVFPDAELLEVGTAVTAMQKHHLEVRDVESLREHYARTLRVWIKNLEENWEQAQQLVGPARARVWLLYMAGSALGFEENRIAIHQVLSVRTESTGASNMAPTRAWLDVEHPAPHA